MDSLDSTSLTKGYFVHRPSKVKKLSCVHSKRFQSSKAYEILWNNIAAEIQEIQTKSYKATFNEILEFAKQCFKLPLQKVNEVPAAVLLLGVNMPDHSNIFHLFEQFLHLNDVFSTVILEAKKCNSFSNTLQIICSELLQKFQMFLNFDELFSRKKDCSFQNLHFLYETVIREHGKVAKKKGQESKRKTETNKLGPIIFLIQNVETFNVEVLKELILNCKIYSGKLPIILLFGMASAMVTLHKILPQKALSCLGVETFRSMTATEYLTRIIEEVIMAPHQPFKIGPKVFRLIVDTVLYHDFSVLNLTHLLKFSITEHFYSNKFKVLCCYECDIEKKIKGFNFENLKFFKTLPSIQKYSSNHKDFLSCMKNSSSYKASISQLMKNFYHTQKVQMVLLQLLHSLIKDLPGFPLGKQFRELYSFYLNEQITSTHGYNEAVKLLKLQSQNNLLMKLETCLEILNNSSSQLDISTLNDAKEIFESSIKKLSVISSADFQTNNLEPFSLEGETVTSRFQLQEKIRQNLTQKRSKFEALRSDIIDNVLSLFEAIYPPSHLPLYEVFYYDDVSSLKKHLMAVSRVTSCNALSDPRQYFKCPCCKIRNPEEILPLMPDICILYKLHLECGKLINLRDLLDNFKSFKRKEDGPKRRVKMSAKSKDTETQFNIRFLQAVTELQLLGFIKSTRRKTDHVARLTFGCF